MDLYNREKYYLRNLENFKNEKKLKGRNKALIMRFVEYQKGRRLSFERLSKFLRMIIHISNLVGKDLDKVDKDDIVIVVNKIRDLKQFSELTKRDYNVVLRTFYKWLAETEGYKHIDFVEKYVKTNAKVESPISPNDVLSPEEITMFINSAKTLRDRCLISLLYYSGARIGEVIPLQWKHCKFDSDGCVLYVNGTKTASSVRQVRLAEEPTQILLQWKSAHQWKDDPESPIFISFESKDKPESISYPAVAKMLKITAKRAKIAKHVHAHLLRHSRVSHLYSKMSLLQLKRFGGWALGSKVMEKTYIHFDDDAVSKAIVQLEGTSANRMKKLDDVMFQLWKTNPDFKKIILDEIKKKGGL